jgi:hypothetical protein
MLNSIELLLSVMRSIELLELRHRMTNLNTKGEYSKTIASVDIILSMRNGSLAPVKDTVLFKHYLDKGIS